MTKKEVQSLRAGDRVAWDAPGTEDHGVEGVVKLNYQGFYIQWNDQENINITPEYNQKKLAPYLKRIKD